MRYSNYYFIFVSTCTLAIALILVHAGMSQSVAREQRTYRRQLVKDLQLTDLCLFTEARYTRHLSMADTHAPFQDHPGALEHFPSGSLTTPPLLNEAR